MSCVIPFGQVSPDVILDHIHPVKASILFYVSICLHTSLSLHMLCSNHLGACVKNLSRICSVYSLLKMLFAASTVWKESEFVHVYAVQVMDQTTWVAGSEHSLALSARTRGPTCINRWPGQYQVGRTGQQSMCFSCSCSKSAAVHAVT